MRIDLSEALALHQAGELDRASRLYEAAILADPGFDAALYLLGRIAIRQGDPTRALALLGRAIAIQPNASAYHGALAEAYRSLGQSDRAIQAARESLRCDPGNWEVRCQLASTLAGTGRLDDAIELFREATRLRPDFAQAYNNLGHALQVRGDSTGALEQFQVALRLDPTSFEAHANLGKTLLDRGETEAALIHCQEAARLQPQSAMAQYKLGNVYQVLGRLDEAEACFRRATVYDPGLAAGHACLGSILEQLGDPDSSLASYRETLRLEPENAWVLAKLAIRFKDRLPQADQDAIERLLASPTLISELRIPLLYGYAHVFDGRGEFDPAASLTIEANARQNAEFAERGLTHDLEARSKDVENLIEAFSTDFFARIRGWGSTTDRPVFVVGMPRSGTSLVEQILASHSQVFGAGELSLASRTFQAFLELSGPARSLGECLDRLDRPAIERLTRLHLDRLEAIEGSSSRIVDKLPENTLFLGLIAAIFPNARVIYCRRDARDTALSCWMTHFGHLRWSCSADQIAAKIVETERIMRHWQSVLPSPILEVVYEDLIEDLEARAREMIAWLGLEWEPACLEFHKTRREVRTASLLQVRQPIYRGSVGRWKNYEKPLVFLFEPLHS